MKKMALVLVTIVLFMAGCGATEKKDAKKSESVEPLVVATYNVSVSAPQNSEAQRKLLADAGVQVFGMQEVDENFIVDPTITVNRMEDFMKEPYKYGYFGKSMKKGAGEYGNAIVSSFELADTETMHLYSDDAAPKKYRDMVLDAYDNYKYGDAESDKRMDALWGTEGIIYQKDGGLEPRSVQKAELKVGDKTVSFYNSHLSFENNDVRKKQFEFLKDLLDKDPNPYKILTGDFNTDQTTSDYDLFTKDYQLANGHDNHWLDTFNDEDPTMKIKTVDNIIVTKNITIDKVEVLKSDLSDHSPLVAHLTLK